MHGIFEVVISPWGGLECVTCPGELKLGRNIGEASRVRDCSVTGDTVKRLLVVNLFKLVGVEWPVLALVGTQSIPKNF